MALTIDDTGLIRLGCSFLIAQIPPANEYVITTFYSPKKHRRCVSDLTVTEASVLNALTTDGGWLVSARNGSFSITKIDNTLNNLSY